MLLIAARKKCAIFGSSSHSTMRTKKKTEYLRTSFNVSHHAAPAKCPAPRERVDTVYPEPQERNWHRTQKEEWNIRPFLESVKVPVPMTEFTKVKPFSDAIKKTFFPEVDSLDDLPKEEESDEDEPVIRPNVRRQGKQPTNQVPNDCSESDDEEENRSPGLPAHCPETKTGAFTDQLRIRQMSEEEFDKYNADQKKQVSPAIKVGAYLGKHFFQEILVDIGADCNLVDLNTAKKIIEKTKNCKLHTDRNEMTITGVAGRTNISGYLVVPIDLGQGVVCQDVIYVVDDIFRGESKMLLGKPFLVVIDATVGVRYDYLSVPSSDGAPIHVSGWKYLGKGVWQEVQFPKSTRAVLSKAKIEKARQQYAIEHDDNPITHLEDNLGNYCHPWAGIIYSCTIRAKPEGVDATRLPEYPSATNDGVPRLLPVIYGDWMGMESVSAAHFGWHVAALFCRQASSAFSVEGGVPMGRGDLDAGLFAGYTKETASEEGLTEFVVDDITWWVCLEGVSEAQQRRLKDILCRNRPYVATSVHEMWHCSPETVVHDLIPKEDAVWQIAKKRRQFAPLEMQ